MRLERITIINIRKHIGRLGLLTLVLTVVVATVATLYILARLMNDDLEKKLDLYGTNMIIVPKSEDLPLSYDGVPLGNVNLAKRNLTERDVAALKTIKNKENLAVIAPKLIGIAKLRGEDAIVVGVDFPKELKMKKWWRLRAGKKPKKGTDQVLVGAAAAARHRLKVGQTIKIKGQKFKVAGILKSAGSQEDEPVYIDLGRAQKIFRQPAQFSIIEVSAWCYNCPINVIVGQASEKLPHAQVSAVRQVAQTRNKVLKQFEIFAAALSVVMVAVGGLIIFTNMLAAVRERRREIGIFRAIGFRRSNILEIILFETVIVSLVGGIAGYLLGVLSAWLLAPSLGITLPVELDVNVAYFSVLGTLVLTLVSSLYPALTAANMSPTIAINDI